MKEVFPNMLLLLEETMCPVLMDHTCKSNFLGAGRRRCNRGYDYGEAVSIKEEKS